MEQAINEQIVQHLYKNIQKAAQIDGLNFLNFYKMTRLPWVLAKKIFKISKFPY